MAEWATPMLSLGSNRDVVLDTSPSQGTPIPPKFKLMRTASEYGDIKKATLAESKELAFGSKDPFQDKRFDEEASSLIACTRQWS
jgi:hypothetical protein